MELNTKHPVFLVKQVSPFNGEPPLDRLIQSFITPLELFFTRNHGTIPSLDPGSYRLSVTGSVRKPLSLSLDDLMSRFPKRRLTATLQCAGNRRSELASVAPTPGELPWDAGAIGTAEWGGTPLREVLNAAEVQMSAGHTAFSGLDEVEREGRSFGFGGSIPLGKASSAEVLLAYEMNGKPLPREHGFPVRLVVPGYIGARSVKWLSEIRIQEAPSDNYFYERAYQLFPPGIRQETVNWLHGIKLGEMPVNSVICSPQEGEQISGRRVRIQGYAISGGGRRVERVDLSADGGKTWITAELGDHDSAWTWRFWEARMDLPPGSVEIAARAWDSSASTQPEEIATVWNFKGYMNNALHRVRVFLEG